MSTTKRVGSKGIKKRNLLFSTAIVTSLIVGGQVVAQENKAASHYEIPAQPLEDSLNAFAMQADVEVLYTSDDVRAIEAPAISGASSREQAIAQLLAGTGLTYRFTDSGALIVRAPEKTSVISGQGGRIEMAQIAEPRAAAIQGAAVGQASATRDEGEVGQGWNMEEMVVTGSSIRGVGFGASPAFVLDRDYIDSTGFSTIEQLIDSIPQSFGSVGADVVSSPDRDSALNRGAGSSVNLRGLGSGATLVLLNGRRLAPSGEGGGFVDVSLIPLSAIERVEVLTDGASAIYGTDAVAGVVNFITRRDFVGAETLVRYGTVTEGGLDEYKVSQTFGESWGDGNVLFTYEYFNRDNLGSEERGFSSLVTDADLIPGEERHSVFLSASQQVTQRAVISADILYSNRDSDTRTNTTAPRLRNANTEQLNASVGTEVQLTESWTLDVFGNYSRNDLGFRIELNFPNSGVADSELVSTNIKADGDLFDLPGGPMKLAVGAGYRHEAFRFENTFLETVNADLGRDVYSAFGELFIPIISDRNRIPGAERVELTVAGRFEDYSDFGSTTRPKVGVLWSPFGGLALRGTYSSSFKAPNLSDLPESANAAGTFPAIDPTSPSGSTVTLRLLGNNMDLGPEEATAWTAGVDFQPELLPGLSVKLTYFDIEFEDRVDIAFTNIFDPLLNPDIFADVITRDPDPSLVATRVAEAEAAGGFFNFGGPGFTPLIPFDPADVGAIIDQRLRNISEVNVRGIEFEIDYGFETEIGEFNFGARGDYLFDLQESITSASPSVDFVDTIFNPAEFRMRGNASWSFVGFNITTFVNYVDGYTDNRSETEVSVDSWTTVDIQLSYQTRRNFDQPWLNNIRFSISALNLFDEDPPSVQADSFSRLAFDPTNSSALGRFIAFQIEKTW